MAGGLPGGRITCLNDEYGLRMNGSARVPQDRWVFAYGSLLWNPGFPYVERLRGVLRGYHRSLCVYSHVHRGTIARPGLVLGLDRGGACVGAVYRVAESDWESTLGYLRAREQVTAIYREVSAPVTIAGGRRVQAVGYVVDRRHHQYSGRLALEDTVALVRQGVGRSGHNVEYVLRTHAHLVEMGIEDAFLANVAALLADVGEPRQPVAVSSAASEASF